jgi:hypothetical protein
VSADGGDADAWSMACPLVFWPPARPWWSATTVWLRSGSGRQRPRRRSSHGWVLASMRGAVKLLPAAAIDGKLLHGTVTDTGRVFLTPRHPHPLHRLERAGISEQVEEHIPGHPGTAPATPRR